MRWLLGTSLTLARTSRFSAITSQAHLKTQNVFMSVERKVADDIDYRYGEALAHLVCYCSCNVVYVLQLLFTN